MTDKTTLRSITTVFESGASRSFRIERASDGTVEEFICRPDYDTAAEALGDGADSEEIVERARLNLGWCTAGGALTPLSSGTAKPGSRFAVQHLNGTHVASFATEAEAAASCEAVNTNAVEKLGAGHFESGGLPYEVTKLGDNLEVT
jgi:hypothetical protein